MNIFEICFSKTVPALQESLNHNLRVSTWAFHDLSLIIPATAQHEVSTVM
jgi:hypothetical protein